MKTKERVIDIGQLTAYFLIGERECFYGRLNEVFTLNLYENSEPRLIYRPYDQGYKRNEVTFIPTLDHMFEDALLIFALHYLKDERIWDIYKHYDQFEQEQPFRICNIPIDKREELYKRIKRLTWGDTKILLTTFAPSHLNQFLNDINTNQVPIEVFQSKF